MADRGFSKHFDGRRFYNLDAPQARGFLDGLRWKLTSRPEPWPPSIEDVVPSVPSRSVDASQVRVTMVNHSTLLVQSSGFNLLTDPIWSERASPVSWIGPKRRRRPGVRIDDLPSIDAVLISHNHFDHLDLPTLRQLATRGRSTFVVAARCARLLCPKQSNPVTSCIGESHWPFPASTSTAYRPCTSQPVAFLTVTRPCGVDTQLNIPKALCTSRGTLASKVIFAHIRESFGSLQLALLPIGAYEPRWLCRRCTWLPKNGVKTSIAIHHGTFQLADDGIDTPQKQLMACRRDDSFLILRNGESAEISS